MRIQERRHFFARRVVERLVQIPCHAGSVFALEMHIVRLRKAELGKKSVVSLRQAHRLLGATGKVENLIGTIDSGDWRGNGIVFA